MIVGENTIIPTFNSFYSDDPDWWAKLTDNYYASTEGSNPDTPEISIGRIIGDSPLEMKNAIETCIEMAKGDFTLDNSNAYLLAGADINEFEIYSRQIEREILIPKGFDTLVELSFGPTAVNDVDFYEHAKDQDIINIYGHGSPTGTAGIINTANVISSFDPNSTRPLLSLFWSCDTGMYNRGKSLAEAFIEKGASAYIGATSRSDGGAANPLAREFYSRLGPSSPIGQILRDAKSNVVNNTDIGRTVRKYNCAVNHLFGDPKMELEGWPDPASASSTNELILNQEPPAYIQIYLPDYEVTEINGMDHIHVLLSIP